jgi:excisionase family DNA binding protein
MEGIQKINLQLERLRELIERYEKPLTLIEAAKYLGFSPSYIYKLTSKNAIPFYKPSGKKILFLKKELDEWIIKGKRRSTNNEQCTVYN